uniref:Uncharacterized protein n=1 Tax=Mycena chlorophos TaxID=658473 RepID=A0ABQ0LIW5_MYCCL|nr:predicted protein [Mycena chlorophos]
MCQRATSGDSTSRLAPDHHLEPSLPLRCVLYPFTISLYFPRRHPTLTAALQPASAISAPQSLADVSRVCSLQLRRQRVGAVTVVSQGYPKGYPILLTQIQSAAKAGSGDLDVEGPSYPGNLSQRHITPQEPTYCSLSPWDHPIPREESQDTPKCRF